MANEQKVPPKHLKGLYKFCIACLLMLTVLVYSGVSNLIMDNSIKTYNGAQNSLLKSDKNLHQKLLNSDSGSRIAANQRQLLQDDDLECRFVHQIEGVDEKCEFVQNTSSCEAGGPIDYNQFVFCDLGHAVWGAMIILIIWWLFCFCGLACTADDFFCPSLVVIAKTLRLSPNVAISLYGVTFLAFGNGAPDLFSAIAALSETDEGDAGLGVGGLLGAGMFVTSVVTGTIAVIKPFKAMERPFLRDITFYMFGVFWTFTTLWRGKIYLAESIGFIIAYIMYVIVVVASGSIYKKQKEKEKLKKAVSAAVDFLAVTSEGRYKMIGDSFSLPSFDLTDTSKMPRSPTELSIYQNTAFQGDEPPEKKKLERKYSIEDFMKTKADMNSVKHSISFELGTIDEKLEEEPSTHVEKNGHAIQRLTSEESVISQATSTTSTSDEDPFSEFRNDDEEEEVREMDSPVMQFLNGINPINLEEWPEMGIFGKFYEIFKCPLIFGLQLTCPVVNYDVELNDNWNKYLQCFQCLFTPMIVSIMIGFGLTQINDVFPVWALLLLCGVPLCLLVYFTSVDYEQPKYHWAFGYAGFFISMIWIYTIANSIVNLLQTFGIVLNISDAILGLTLLAWGNSIGDWIANTVMARQGFARMGFSACFGAPFFNLMLGFGIPMLVTMGKTGDTEVELYITPVQLILSGFLLTNLCINIIFLNVSRFRVNRVYGIIMVTYYIVFLVSAILTESGVIFSNWEQPRECYVGCEG